MLAPGEGRSKQDPREDSEGHVPTVGSGGLRRPSPLQFLAWSSPALTSEFVALLPVLVDAGTAVEMLHLLLDLPSLTAALDLQLR